MTSGIEFTEEEVVAKKQKMVEWIEESIKGTFTQACSVVGICRAQGYKWGRADPEWKKKIDEARVQANASGLDFMESSIMKLISEGNVAAVIFALKCLGRSRGWIEKNDVSFDPLKVQVTYESSREYLISKLLSDVAPRNTTGQTIEHDADRNLPATI